MFLPPDVLLPGPLFATVVLFLCFASYAAGHADGEIRGFKRGVVLMTETYNAARMQIAQALRSATSQRSESSTSDDSEPSTAL